MKRIILAMAAVAAVSASAQDLSTEITVDRIVLPEQKAAQRPLLIPSILQPAAFEAKITPAEYLQTGSITNSIATLAAPSWQDSIAQTPYMGYASLGYFPMANKGANIGYRFLNSAKAIAGAWAQFDFNRYKSMDVKTGTCFTSGGAYGAYNLNEHSRLDLDVFYQYGSVKAPEIEDITTDTDNLSSNLMSLNAAWKSHPGKISYHVGAGMRYFGYSGTKPAFGNLAHQTALNFAVGAGLADDAPQSPSWLGLDIKGTALSTNNAMPSMGLYSFHPYVIFGQDGDFSARLGINVNIATVGNYVVGEDVVPSSTEVKVAPQVTLSYHPNQGIASAFVTFNGGQQLNQIADLYAINPYLNTQQAYGISNVPMQVEGGINVGRTQGFMLQIFGGYALARNWYLPALPMILGGAPDQYFMGQAVNESYDFNSWHVGAKVSYAYRSLIEGGLSAEAAGSNDDLSNATWLNWADRAKYVLGVYVLGRPMHKLEVKLGYESRACRSIGLENADVKQLYNLHNLSNLYLQAHYDITPAFTAFARGENLLGHKSLMVGYVPMQGVHGLVGIAAKF